MPGVNRAEYHSLIASASQSKAELVKLGNRVTSVERNIRVLSKSTRLEAPLHPRVNYFSLGLGTLVDPYLTSPTKRLSPRPLQFTWFAKIFDVKYKTAAPGPVAALQPWEDHGECWCAPESGGKSMLGLVLAQKVIPQELVVEHMPRESTLTIGSAPKDIELWVQILDAEKREQISSTIYNLDPTEPEEDKHPDRTYGTMRAMDKTWVRIGKFRYDIFSKSNIQTFQIGIGLDKFDAPVDRVVVRVQSNWGGDSIGHVCLYRLKLHGMFAGKQPNL